MRTCNFVYAKKIHCILNVNQPQWLKSCVKFNTQKIIDAEKMVINMEKQCTN